MINNSDDPTGQLLPFILHSRVDQNKFDHYFCWMMVDNFENEDYQIDQDTNFQTGNFIKSFKIEYYQRIDEPQNFGQCNLENSGMRYDVLTKHRRCSNMFTKSKNWIESGKDQYQCMYMVGNNIDSNGIEQIEIKEFLVELNYNQNEKYVIDITIKPRQFIYLTFTEEFITQIRSNYDNTNPIENNRLIPQFQDNGQINGIYLMVNQQQYHYGYQRIKMEQVKTSLNEDQQHRRIL